MQGRRRRQETRCLVGGDSKRRAAFYILWILCAGALADDWPGLVVPRPANVVRSIPRRRLRFLVCDRLYKSIETFPYIIYSATRVYIVSYRKTIVMGPKNHFYVFKQHQRAVIASSDEQNSPMEP